MRRPTGWGLLDRFLRNLVEGLISFGTHWVHTPSRAVEGSGPPIGHPERLRSDVPLTDLERFLLHDLGPLEKLPELF
ncbi:DUF6059 family protein [Wenjunlia tyrosinilytica]|uniref:Uncharacterized protein n=1 Tax=Wenjunlia tyrosinilytica TaxID=1544741 RepID=A0A918DYX6_9ACTN|nr:DUF6059 family protein [Wenjunlia tyrosinilytica]GGO88914.1 hypothetical protein GCM10012280_30830 [Wenjunlia tyrosinilytica]